MHNYKELYKLIENLKLKIKKLDNQKNKLSKNSSINSYRIFSPKIKDNNKKYIGLLFDNNFDDFNTDSSNNLDNCISFIKLKKSNIIINYSLLIDINTMTNSSTICSISLGIKDKNNSKIKIIKGTKNIFDINNKSIIFSNKIQINNTILYDSNIDGEELCMVAELPNYCSINFKKSLLKILYI